MKYLDFRNHISSTPLGSQSKSRFFFSKMGLLVKIVCCLFNSSLLRFFHHFAFFDRKFRNATTPFAELKVLQRWERTWGNVFIFQPYVIWMGNCPLYANVFINCELIMSDVKMSDVRRFFVWIFFRPKFNKFAVECAWKRKVSQNVRNLDFFQENRCFFHWKFYFFKKNR